ncbi:TonB-dependent receptor domain-containing protein [Fluviicola sp.]|uniref:TonB-dependent receptor domain-containing protein n=1 Tax=Fluviicola sp. TaxID=1917219 RepID=UPI003D2E04E6
MKRTLILACILLCSMELFAQSQWINFSFVSKDFPCEDVSKELTISTFLSGKDSTIFKQQFSECSRLIEIPKIAGTYSFTVKTQLYQPILLSFEIRANTADTVQLGELVLKETVSVLDEVTVTGIQRRFIQVDADKTTITVKDNPVLTVSSIYDAVLKIPGVVPYPGGGFAISGQIASVYFEGIPSSLSTDDLVNLLKSLPATSVETIEIISNPGASYDANVTGAIINIVSLGKVTKWLSGTFTLNYGLNQNNKLSPSLVMSGRRSRWNWQFQAGYSYNERSNLTTANKTYTSFNPVASLISERKEQTVSQYYYFKPSVNVRLTKRSNLILNYNGSYSDNIYNGNSTTSSQEITPAVDLQTKYWSRNIGQNNEFIVKYRNEFDTLHRVLNITAFYSTYWNNSRRNNTQREFASEDFSVLNYRLKIQKFYFRADAEIPFEKIKFYLNTGIKYQNLNTNNIGSYNLQNTSEDIFANPFYTSSIDFKYREDNLAAYVELKKRLGKKVSIGAGVRAENFSLTRSSNITVSAQNNYFNFFPSFNAIYRISSDINLIGTYSRKIGIPNFSQFDPNNSGYYDTYNSSTGNTQLKPNFYDNAELKFTVFDYLQLSVDYTHSGSLNLSEIVVQPNSLQSVQTFKTYNNVNTVSYFMSLPVPFGIFKKGLKFFDEPVEIDKISFMYLYGEFTKTQISGYNYLERNKGIWTAGVYSQFILPWKIRMNVDYYISAKGNYQIYQFIKNRSALEVVFSREFYDKKLKTSLSFEDIFNTDQSTTRLAFQNLNMDSYSKNDTRIIWFKVSYSFGRYEKPESDAGGPPEKPNLNGGL